MEYPDNTKGLTSEEDSSHRQNILRKIELYQKVFPRHQVVGWYRVHTANNNNTSSEAMTDNSSSSLVDIVPTEDDLRMNQEEMTQYCGEGVESPLFVLMNAASPQYTGVSSSEDDTKPSSAAAAGSSLDDTLPLTVYETLVSEGGTAGGGSAFVNATFELETQEPERIAVERVFQTQMSNAAGSAAQQKEKEELSSAAAANKDGNKQGGSGSNKRDDNKKGGFQSTFARGPSELEMQLDSLQSSIRSMNVRMAVLLEFLQKVEKGELPPDNALLRSIDGLLQQLPLVLAALKEGSSSTTTTRTATTQPPLVEFEHDYTDTMLLSYLAAVAKTAKSVHVYSEKFRGAFESGKSDGRRTMY